MTHSCRSLLLVFLLIVGRASAQEHEPDTSFAGNDKVAEIIRNFEGRGAMPDGSQPTPARQAVKQFQLRDGFEIDLVASEPDVSQPLFLTWDSRGRMWVVQYRQYQYPAGLKVVRYDQHLRAVFDKVPEPPPRGTPGADKITVFEDLDGDGLYDYGKDVITGLNIASAVQIGHGGIWVLNPPYLLFYPDADGDDVPDSDPEVHLSGFGLQDTHSVANSLIWGPDGWLYGANGSTTVGTISSQVTKGVSFQGQCIWRYHPDMKVFEIYAEGGGNTFSLEIDSKGRVFSGHNGGGTRGFYYPQGTYSQKNWGKHGPLTNPYAFGFFRQMECVGDQRRFAQAFLIYEGGLFPAPYAGSIVAPNSLQNLIWHSRRIRDGSTYRTVDEQNLAQSSDRWFRPVYGGVGPDGAVYVADWYDTRLSHVSPIDNWHKESGRIYRIRPSDSKPKNDMGDLQKLDADELLAKFDHSNKWVRRRAMLELGWRGDKSAVTNLVRRVNEEASLESLWALNLLNELSAARAIEWMQHNDPHIRRWVVRLLGDRGVSVAPAQNSAGPDYPRHPRDARAYEELAKLAATESDVQVRSQLASAAKRLATKFALPITGQLLRHSEDINDPHLPLMNWWALEAHAEQWPDIERMLGNQSLWQLPMFRTVIAGRLMQRYAASGSADDLQRCAQLVELAPDDSSTELLIAGLNQAFQGRAIPKLPKSLDDALSKYQQARGEAGIVVAIRQGKSDAVTQAIDMLRDDAVDLGVRIELARAFGEVNQRAAVDTLIRLATGRGTGGPALQRVAIRSLGLYDDDRISTALVQAFGGEISAEHDLRATACRTLAARESWAKALLVEINEWRLKPSDIPTDVIQQLRTYRNNELVAAVEEAFGKPVAISAPEKIAAIRRLTDVLNSSTGNPQAGKLHFTKHCATCHRLFGEGQQIGPPLDAYDRGSLKFWLPAIIEPSLEIREGYQSYMAVTLNGRVVTGVITAQDLKTVTLGTADNQTIVLARDDLEELQAIKTSLMPEDVLKDLSDEQITDLFAYLSLGARK